MCGDVTKRRKDHSYNACFIVMTSTSEFQTLKYQPQVQDDVFSILNPATMPTTLHHIHAISSISIT